MNWRLDSIPIGTAAAAHALDGPVAGLVAAQRKELYDEPCERMDEWMGGRRDVDLDGNRRAGNGPASLCG
jgi:hypothetical protein